MVKVGKGENKLTKGRPEEQVRKLLSFLSADVPNVSFARCDNDLCVESLSFCLGGIEDRTNGAHQRRGQHPR